MNTSRNLALPARLSIGAALLVALGACGDDSTDGPPTADPSASPSSAAPSSSSSSDTDPSAGVPSTPTEPTEPRLISYTGGESTGVYVQRPAQVSRLRGAPASFKAFVGETVTQLQDGADCDGAAVGVSVDAIRTDGFAVGGISECGGYAALWADVDGSWMEIDGTQDTWDCAILKKYVVPSDIAGDSCFAYHGDEKGHAYHQA